MGSPWEVGSVRREDGTTIAYDLAGSGPAMVFLHGLASHRGGWGPITDLLVDSFTCVRVDARGHGQSSKASEYGVVAMASDVGAVMSELDLDAPAVVGHSLGGTTAVLVALAHRVRAIAVVDQPLRPSDFAGRVRPLETRLRDDGFVDAMLEFEAGLGIGDLSAPARAELEAAIRTVDREVVLGVWAQLFASTDEELDEAMSAALPHVRSPLLSLHGSQPEEHYIDWLRDAVPHAEVEVWDGQGHFLHLVDPERFADRLRDLPS